MNREQSIQAQVRGFLVPEFRQELPNGQTLNGLTEEGFRMVAEGYACGECLAIFDHYTVKCPICGLSRDVMADVQEAPQLWLDHLAERYSDEPYEKPPVVNPFMDPGEDLPEILKEADQIPIEKLRKRRR